MSLGSIFAFLALSIGTMFFLYAMKYYITLALVLGFSRKASRNNNNKANSNNIGRRTGLVTENNNNNNNFKKRGILYRLFGKGLNHNNNNRFNNNNHGLGMIPDYEKLRLKKQPFVSIHLPFYNEKKVANRILTACTSMDYQNYEVVVVDDSTDETVQILEKWKQHPKVKVIHRTSREGFKGGALKVALELSDPRTEFVVIFDADFIPYPDTIWQFLKYFNIGVNGNNNNNNHNNIENGFYKHSNIAAVQGYQWHVLNKNENWITRGVRTEFAGSYVVERPGTEVIGSMKLIAGSVYMIRADLLKKYGWGTSITEDFQLTLRLYADGYRVIFTPYIQAPSECVSTIKRLIRQRMRWAEGHTNNVKKMFWKILRSPYLRKREKLEFLYLCPYYLQAAFFLIGTLSWFISDAIFKTSLPFWTSLWGWCLVLTNMFALPLMNGVGLFLEESPKKDYLGLFSFVLLCYIVVPFQAYAALKGLFKKEEGHWFRTPKSGHITDVFLRSRFRRFFEALFPGRRGVTHSQISNLAFQTANNQFNNFGIRRRNIFWLPKLILVIFLSLSVSLFVFTREVPSANAAISSNTQYFSKTASGEITSVTAWQLQESLPSTDCVVGTDCPGIVKNTVANYRYKPGVTANATGETIDGPSGAGWIVDGAANGVQIAAGTWTFKVCIDATDADDDSAGYGRARAWKVATSGGSITGSTLIVDTTTSGSAQDWWVDGYYTITGSGGATTFDSQNHLYLEVWNIKTAKGDALVDISTMRVTGGEFCGSGNDTIVQTPTVTVFEGVITLLVIIPFLPFLIRKLQEVKR